MPKRVIKRGDEEFVVALADDGKSATVTDEKDFTVRISYTRGEKPFNVRTPGGWGGWKRTMDDAVAWAAQLCVEARTFLESDEFAEQLAKYVEEGAPKA